MSTDFENELRDLFREKAEEAPLATPTLPAIAPRQVLRRSRRRQVGTVIGSAVVIVALIVGSVAGLTQILGEGNDDEVGDGDYEVFQRTATVEAFTVGSPSDWYLVNQWPMSMLIPVEVSGGSSSACIAAPGDVSQECEGHPGNSDTSSPIPTPHGLPMLQLSNIDLGLAANACADGAPRETPPSSTWRSTTTLRSPASRIRRSRNSHPASASRRRETARAVPVDTRTSRSTASDSSPGSGSAPARATKTGKRSRPPTR